MNILNRWFGIAVGISLAVGAVSLPVWAQSTSPVYYAAQLGGGSLAALAGGLAGTLVGSGLIGEVVNGAEVGFGLGASLGATWGVLQVASAYGVRGDPTLAFVGALAGTIVGMILLPDSASPHPQWRMDAKGLRIQSSVMLRSLINPVTLAALGATIGYNLGTKPRKEGTPATIAVPLYALQF